MKRAFTLIELLIVIGIIAILAGTLLGNYSNITNRVRAAKCQTNLRNLAQAVGSYLVSSGRYPFAGTAEYIRTTGGTDNQGLEIGEFKGWVSADTRGVNYPIQGNNPANPTPISYANGDYDTVNYAITNGAIWEAVGMNKDCYLCPVHVEACRRQGVRQPGWSYQMNAYFGFGGGELLTAGSYIEAASVTRADRILLFAEIPALAPNSKDALKAKAKLPEPNLTGGNSDPAMCGCLVSRTTASGHPGANGGGGNASIGFNHVRGRDIVGHVAFADGHVEALVAPKNGNFDDLTDWLCQGKDIVIQGKDYQEVKDSEAQ